MNLQQQTYTSPLEVAAPILVFLSGLAFCVVIKLLNVSIMIFSDAVEGNYLISKSYYGVNYFWLCETIFTGFFFLGLLSLIRDKGKIYSAALIVSCLAIAINVVVIKAAMKKGHMMSIVILETALQRAEIDPASEPYISAAMPIYRDRYKTMVEQWNEIQKNKYEPVN